MRSTLTIAAVAFAVTARAQPVLPADPTITSPPTEPLRDFKAQAGRPAEFTLTQGPSDAELYQRQNDADFVGYTLSGSTYLSVTCPSGNIFLTNANYALCGTAGQSQVPTACRSNSVLVYSATARTCSQGMGCSPDWYYDSTDDKSAKAMYGCGQHNDNIEADDNLKANNYIATNDHIAADNLVKTNHVVFDTSAAAIFLFVDDLERPSTTIIFRKEGPPDINPQGRAPTTEQPKSSKAPDPETTKQDSAPTTTKESNNEVSNAGSSLVPVETINVTQTRTVTSTATSTDTPGGGDVVENKSGTDSDSSNSNSTSSNNGGGSSDKKDQAWIAGPVVGGVGAIAAVAALFFVVRLLRRRSAKEEERAAHIEASMHEKPTDHSPVSPITSASPHQTIRSSELPAYRQVSPPSELQQSVYSAELSGYSSPQQSRVQSAELPAFMVPPQPPQPMASAELPAYRMASPPVELQGGVAQGGAPHGGQYPPGHWQSPDDYGRR
ncbi:unnamed protein product [Clonostachys rosea f. rosea IK726]|uniref:Uncharacterized protein n=1 Tax=Clonostachys rosea f. rosea IK726 TaxID=1349383 RepID=A0ACA9UJL3_BIOOC|nr:unnamed protein product [Clonostachys rosea f. rosea IK726]